MIVTGESTSAWSGPAMSARQERLGLYKRFEPDLISVSLDVQQFGLCACIGKCSQSQAYAVSVACRPDDDEVLYDGYVLFSRQPPRTADRRLPARS